MRSDNDWLPETCLKSRSTRREFFEAIYEEACESIGLFMGVHAELQAAEESAIEPTLVAKEGRIDVIFQTEGGEARVEIPTDGRYPSEAAFWEFVDRRFDEAINGLGGSLEKSE